MVERRDRIRVAFDAHVVGRRRTGNERYAVELATALATRDDVELLVYLDRGRAWPRMRVDGMQRRDLHIAWPQLRIPYELPLRARRDRADLLHVQYVTPPIAGLPVVTLISDLSFEDLADAFPRRTTLRLRMTIRVAARRSTVVLAPSGFTRQRLIRTYGLDPDWVHLTPLGVSDGWQPLRLDEAYRRVAGMRLPESFVLAVGTMHPRKNMPRLVRAVAEARRRGAGDLALVIAGASGWQSTSVDEAVEAVGGSESVLVAGIVVVGALQGWLIAVSPTLVPLVFGDQWTPAIAALQFMCLATLATVPTRFLRSLLFGQGRSRQGLTVAIASTAICFVAFPPLALSFGIAGGGMAFAIAGIGGLILHAVAARDVASFPWATLGRIYLLALVASLAAWLAADRVDGLPGQVLSAAVFGAIDLLLLATFVRPELERTWRLIRRPPGAAAVAVS